MVPLPAAAASRLALESSRRLLASSVSAAGPRAVLGTALLGRSQRLGAPGERRCIAHWTSHGADRRRLLWIRERRANLLLGPRLARAMHAPGGPGGIRDGERASWRIRALFGRPKKEEKKEEAMPPPAATPPPASPAAPQSPIQVFFDGFSKKKDKGSAAPPQPLPQSPPGAAAAASTADAAAPAAAPSAERRLLEEFKDAVRAALTGGGGGGGGGGALHDAVRSLLAAGPEPQQPEPQHQPSKPSGQPSALESAMGLLARLSQQPSPTAPAPAAAEKAAAEAAVAAEAAAAAAAKEKEAQQRAADAARDRQLAEERAAAWSALQRAAAEWLGQLGQQKEKKKGGAETNAEGQEKPGPGPGFGAEAAGAELSRLLAQAAREVLQEASVQAALSDSVSAAAAAAALPLPSPPPAPPRRLGPAPPAVDPVPSPSPSPSTEPESEEERLRLALREAVEEEQEEILNLVTRTVARIFSEERARSATGTPPPLILPSDLEPPTPPPAAPSRPSGGPPDPRALLARVTGMPLPPAPPSSAPPPAPSPPPPPASLAPDPRTLLDRVAGFGVAPAAPPPSELSVPPREPAPGAEPGGWFNEIFGGVLSFLWPPDASPAAGPSQAAPHGHDMSAEPLTQIEGDRRELSTYALIADILRKSVHGLGPWSLVDVTLGLFILARQGKTLPDRLEGAPLVTDKQFIASVREYLLLVAGTYSDFRWHIEASHAKFVRSQWESEPRRPAYFLAVNEASRQVILAIRGTESIYDVLTDLDIEPVPFRDGLAHGGMLESARYLRRTLGPELRRLLQARAYSRHARPA
eukprot:tig00000178_g12761.t2